MLGANNSLVGLFLLTTPFLTVMGLLWDGIRRGAHDKDNGECCHGKGRLLTEISLSQYVLSEMSFWHVSACACTVGRHHKASEVSERFQARLVSAFMM